MGLRILGAVYLVLMIGHGSAHAQLADLDVTMTLVSVGDGLPEAVTRHIVLPGSAAPQAVTNSAAGLTIANSNRAAAAARRVEAVTRVTGESRVGLDTAAEARARGAELGADISDAARANRESFIRGDTELDLPAHVPDSAGSPDRPQDPPELSRVPVIDPPSAGT